MAKKDKKNVNKESKEKKSKKSFFKGVKAELKKVIWPTPKQLVNNTIAVVTIVLITTAIVFVLDFVFNTIDEHGIEKIKQSIQTIDSTESEDSDSTNNEENSDTESTDNSEATDSTENDSVSTEESATEGDVADETTGTAEEIVVEDQSTAGNSVE